MDRIAREKQEAEKRLRLIGLVESLDDEEKAILLDLLDDHVGHGKAPCPICGQALAKDRTPVLHWRYSQARYEKDPRRNLPHPAKSFPKVWPPEDS